MPKKEIITQYQFLKAEFMREIHSLRSVDSWGPMTQKELAKHTGMSQTTIHRFMDEKRELTVSEFLIICDLIERPPADFFHRQYSKEQIETFKNRRS